MKSRHEAVKGERVTEIKKKSELSCKNSFDFGKLMLDMPVFLRASYEEGLEEITFTYDISGMKRIEELKNEEKEKQYQFLINFEQLKEAYEQYQITLSMENLYYDENFLPYVKHRDLYSQGEQADPQEYLFLYKSFVGGILGKRYSVQQIQESGLEILKKERFFKDYYDIEDDMELVKTLREQKQLYLVQKHKTKIEVSRKGNLIKTILAIAAPILLVVSLALLAYEILQVVSFQENVIAANEAYISSDYVGCIDSMSDIAVEDMGVSTKYILAVSYARSESLKREEIAALLSRLSLYSNERELEYWIALGRMDMGVAEDLAQSLSDDQLLMYAYMKELNQLESDTTMPGEEKQSRISELESSIQSLGKKYETE